MRFVAASLLGLLLVAPTLARTQPGISPRPKQTGGLNQPLQFEVATIKPVDQNSATPHMMGVTVSPGGRVRLQSLSLESLICAAYNVAFWQLSGGDSWTERDTYDIDAKPPEATPDTPYSTRHSLFNLSDPRLRQMLQALLEDRFNLKFHRVTKEGPVYLLKRSDAPLKLVPTGKLSFSTPEGWSGDIGRAGGRWVIFNTSMPQFATFTSNMVAHRPVLDQTQMSGSFDYTTPPAIIDPQSQAEDFSNEFLLLVKDLGLKLQPSTGPVETMIIDHAEKPSPN